MNIDWHVYFQEAETLWFQFHFLKLRIGDLRYSVSGNLRKLVGLGESGAKYLESRELNTTSRSLGRRDLLH